MIKVKRIKDLKTLNFEEKRTASDGIRIFVDDENISGDDNDYFSSFRNAHWESTDGYAVMTLLYALEKRGILKLECDKDVEECYKRIKTV